jgi:hypothetical protein
LVGGSGFDSPWALKLGLAGGVERGPTLFSGYKFLGCLRRLISIVAPSLTSRALHVAILCGISGGFGGTSCVVSRQIVARGPAIDWTQGDNVGGFRHWGRGSQESAISSTRFKGLRGQPQAFKKLKQMATFLATAEGQDRESEKLIEDLVDASLTRAFTTLYEADVIVGVKLSGLGKRLHFIHIAQELSERMANVSATPPPSPADEVFPFFVRVCLLGGQCSSVVRSQEGGGPDQRWLCKKSCTDIRALVRQECCCGFNEALL